LRGEMPITELNDIRLPQDFTHCTFSQHKKTEVKGELIRNMLLGKLESCAHWVAELVSAGHFAFLWELILHYLAKYINIGNPKMPIYLLMRFGDFKTIIQQRNYISEIDLRNNPSIRQLFTEIIANLASSAKKPGFEPIISLKKNTFDVAELATIMKAPPTQMEQIADILLDDDPNELYIIFAEFSFCLSEKRDQSAACYWVDWIVQYQTHCLKLKEPVKCATRNTMPVEYKYQCNVVWILWEIIIASATNNPLLHKTLCALLDLFCIQYKPVVCSRRINLLFFAVSLITENVDFTVEIISQNAKGDVEYILENNDKYYRELKKNEFAPKTDYMFMGLANQRAQNLKKGIAKMELLANLENR
jgi:hypothetical protein